MNKKNFFSSLNNHFMSKGWNSELISGSQAFVKTSLNITQQKTIVFKPIDKYHTIIERILIENNFTERHFDNVVNKFSDSDYVIACLQQLNTYLYEDQKLERIKLYSFQPVIRNVPNEYVNSPGFSNSFVNVGSISIDCSLEDYINELEMWLSILSACAIHISRIKLIFKEKTNTFDGVGISLYIDDNEIGQCNYYNINIQNKFINVTDFGFGLERICWAANNFAFYDLLIQSPIDYYLDNRDFSEKIKKITLLLMCGVVPNSTKFGIKLRLLFKDYIKDHYKTDAKSSIKFSYDYWNKFITPSICFQQLIEYFKNECIYQMNRQIAEFCDTTINLKQMLKQNDDTVIMLVKNHKFDNKENYL